MLIPALPPQPTRDERARRIATPARRAAALAALLLAAALPWGSAAQQAVPQGSDRTPPQSAPALEPDALARLRETGAALAAARSLRFTASALHDVPTAEGQSVLYAVRSRVTLRRPDHLRIDTGGDEAPAAFVSDGRTMTLYRPSAGTVATAPAPAGLEAVLRAEIAAAGQAQAFADMLLDDPGRTFTDGLTRAFVVGRSALVGGVETEVVAFASPDAQGQIWIGAQDRLPRQLWVTETAAPGRPRSGVTFSDWQLDPILDDRTFSVAGADGARPVPFTKPEL